MAPDVRKTVKTEKDLNDAGGLSTGSRSVSIQKCRKDCKKSDQFMVGDAVVTKLRQVKHL